MDFWAEQCTARGPALTHAHWDRCDSKGVHPADGTEAAGRTHLADMCCHCEMTPAMKTELDIAMQQLGAGTSLGRSLADHLYVPTIVGRCNRCQRTADAHPVSRKVVEPGSDECTVDHTSIATKALIGDGGLQWTSCPLCATMVEPKMATGQLTGPAYGPGRGVLTQRHMDKLVKVANREKFNDWLEQSAG